MFFAKSRAQVQKRTCERVSDIGMSILGNTFQSGQDSVDDIINFKVRNDLFQFRVGNASDLRLDIVKIFDEISQEGLELFLTHRLG